MRILVIINYRPETGGITGQILELVDNLRREGMRIRIVSTHGHPLKRMRGILQALWFSFFSDRLLGVGCAFLGFFPIMVASFCAFVSRTHVTFDFHDGQAPVFLEKHHRLVRFFIGRKRVICASGLVADSFSAYGFNVLRIPYHFDFKRNIYRRMVPFAWNKKVLWSRSFTDLYQPELALKGACIALARDPELEFHFYGTGPLLAPLKIKYSHPRVIFHGFLPRNSFLKEYEKYSIMLTTTAFDNFPLSIVEAGFNHLCVISTRIGGIKTIYSDNEIIFFGDEFELAKKIVEISAKPDQYDSFRENLHKKVLSFNWETVRMAWLEELGIN